MKRFKYRVIICMVLLFIMTGITSCNKEEIADTGFQVYYLNKEITKILPLTYEPEETETEDLINEMIAVLSQDPDSVECKKPLRGDTEIVAWAMEDGQLQISFNSEYSQMNVVTEVLCRAAIVKTLVQIPKVQSVSFFVGDAPVMDKNGNAIGIMTAESFIENPGEQINAIQTATIQLYFPDEEGTGLVKESQKCHYNSNISLEKLVVEQLMAGPLSVEGSSPIPTGTKLISVSVLDGVCFLNFDEGFLNHDYKIREEIVIYAIVNSLAELTSINKVQISVNGDTSITYREKFSFSTVYERNLDYLPAE